MRYATIAGLGHYVPPACVTNAELERRLGEPFHDWLVKHAGIERRHVMAAHETTSDLALAASREALERAGVSARELDLAPRARPHDRRGRPPGGRAARRGHRELARHETLKRHFIADASLSVADGTLTSSFKLRRKAVYERLRDWFEALYEPVRLPDPPG
jgi:hypothetical protein